VTGVWKVGVVKSARTETPSARSLVIDVPGWPGNKAGQHLDLRLTAPDGYTATRSYSIASAGDGTLVELAVDELPDGEVSPYLVEDVMVGDEIELRGPLGGWFVWEPETTGDGTLIAGSKAADGAVVQPVQLIGGGSGVVPLMAMIRAHKASASSARFRLLYSVRTPADVFFAGELAELEKSSPNLEVTWVYTRQTPEGWPEPAGRVSRAALVAHTFAVADNAQVFICGPTGFVEAVANLLVELGHTAASIKTERFGGK
jgi:ferredoxin-NADP reductase